MIHTKDSLLKDLGHSGIDPNGTLLVHSSMKAIGKCEHGADTVLDALIEYMQGGLLIFPTHTWKTVGAQETVYDPTSSSCCVGILPSLFLTRPDVIRSLHPTHSVAAIGKDAKTYTNNEEKHNTPCPRNGCYGKLYDRRAQILFLGCDLSKNTFLHGVEEWNNVPDRMTDQMQELYIQTKDGLLPCPQHRHYCSKCKNVSFHYGKMESAFIATGVAKYCKIGDASCVLGDAVAMADITSRHLKINPDLFIDAAPVSV